MITLSYLLVMLVGFINGWLGGKAFGWQRGFDRGLEVANHRPTVKLAEKLVAAGWEPYCNEWLGGE